MIRFGEKCCHFGKILKAFGDFLKHNLVFEIFLTNFGKMLMLLGRFLCSKWPNIVQII